MVGPTYLSTQLEFSGLDGFREAWTDWTSPFERYRIELEEMIDAGDRVVSLVHHDGHDDDRAASRSRHAGAAVWTVVDGRVRGSSSTSTATRRCGRRASTQ